MDFVGSWTSSWATSKNYFCFKIKDLFEYFSSMSKIFSDFDIDSEFQITVLERANKSLVVIKSVLY